APSAANRAVGRTRSLIRSWRLSFVMMIYPHPERIGSTSVHVQEREIASATPANGDNNSFIERGFSEPEQLDYCVQRLPNRDRRPLVTRCPRNENAGLSNAGSSAPRSKGAIAWPDRESRSLSSGSTRNRPNVMARESWSSDSGPVA